MVMELRVERWLEQARDTRVAQAIEAIYMEAAETIESERPLCLASGHCCHFDSFGHDLFVTAIEAAWFLTKLDQTTTDRGASSQRGGEAFAQLPQLRSENTGRTCPWLEGRLCGARAARPLGCRTFHCDPRSARWSEPLHERLHGRLRAMHEEFGVAYHYDEWLRMLRLFGADQRQVARP